MGGTVLDVIFPRVRRLPSWPRHLESTPQNLVQVTAPPIVTLGGNGANAAYVAARCGADVVLRTALADDVFGALARRWLEDAGCRLHLSPPTRATAVNVVAANARHERAMFFYPGAAVALQAAAAVAGGTTHLLICGWPHPPLATMRRVFRSARARGAFTALDAGPLLGRPWTVRALRSVLGVLDLLLVNEFELRRISRAMTNAAALARLRRDYRGHIVVKCGAEGALWLPADSTTPRRVQDRRVRVANTVGAGDSFNGALLAALANGVEFAGALRIACRVAASVVQSPRGVLGVKPLARRRPDSSPEKSS